jgi:signal peptidase I
LGKITTRGNVGRAIIGAFAIALAMKFFILDFMIAEGDSMAPSIKPGAILLVCKIFYGIKLPGTQSYILQWKIPKEGDIVVFYTPLGETAVKRCGKSPEEGFFYALGDNSSHSYDSRNYGSVSNNSVIGRVLRFK